jgi:hypothetical protein
MRPKACPGHPASPDLSTRGSRMQTTQLFLWPYFRLQQLGRRLFQPSQQLSNDQLLPRRHSAPRMPRDSAVDLVLPTPERMWA